ncbi:MAG: DUF1566 domain-containing protein [Leptospiraceae bacterium]|nr:DUF1566 domain-containing protein [Leptospiraceae bacterium]MDW8306260.1 DUF1566 domain-containing protein [Leptospiraceae bacterium]
MRLKVLLRKKLGFLLLLGLMWTCQGGFERFQPEVNEATLYCLNVEQKSKEDCRSVRKKPPGPTPKVIESFPADGASEVNPATTYIELLFDQPMMEKTQGHVEFFLVSRVLENTEVREHLLPLEAWQSELFWLDDQRVRIFPPWRELIEDAQIAFRPSRDFVSKLNIPVSDIEPLRRFKVARFSGFFPLVKTNQYQCFYYDSSETKWKEDPNCSLTYAENNEDYPEGQNGRYEDNIGMPPQRRTLDGPYEHPQSFTVETVAEGSLLIRPLYVNDTTMNLTWAACSMPDPETKRPPRYNPSVSIDRCADTPGLFLFSQAIFACGVLNKANNGAGYAGLKNWRLPRLDELLTLVDYGYRTNSDNITAPGKSAAILFDRYNQSRNSAAVFRRYFPSKFYEGYYWTSTVARRPAMPPSIPEELAFEIFVVDFRNGNFTALSPLDDSKKAAVLCVSGDNPNRQVRSLIDNGDGTISDTRHGLMWQKCAYGQHPLNCTGTATPVQWTSPNSTTGALNICETSTFASKSDWRLPTIRELLTLYEKSFFNNNLALNPQFFPNSPERFWSSTTNVSHNENPPFPTQDFPQAWFLSFSLAHYQMALSGGGILGSRDKKINVGNPFVRCVRNLP